MNDPVYRWIHSWRSLGRVRSAEWKISRSNVRLGGDGEDRWAVENHRHGKKPGRMPGLLGSLGVPFKNQQSAIGIDQSIEIFYMQLNI
ncbi:MAG: hypothetical protein HC845_14550 [Akkermansiaceae bacterium]|nr:hypothetical protein [Akkermansiaceae bacterium]